jgi:hypothetical protein
MVKIRQWILFLILYAVNAACFALPFTIVPTPGTTLPSFVGVNQTVTAFYNVTNNACVSLNSNFIKYLPPNTTQVTTDPTIPNLCGSTFNFTPNGTAGDTCILELLVSGPIDGNDPDPHHHLFACLNGGVLCAGTNFGLNVQQSSGVPVSLTITPVSVTTAIGHTVQYTAIVNLSDGTSADVTAFTIWSSSNTGVATINSSGTASTLSTGVTTITGTFLNVTANALLTVDDLSIVAGTYSTTSSNTLPILIESFNDGIQWTYAVTSASTNVLPSDQIGGFSVTKTSCSGTHCLVVGSYVNANGTNIYAFQSLDAGSNWSFCIDATTPIPVVAPGYSNGVLNGASCFGNQCIAVGEYHDNNNLENPYVAQTLDGGNSYQNVVNITTPGIPNNGNADLLTGTCTGSICIAAGNYVDNTAANNTNPLLVQSVNAGATWTLAVSSATLPAPSNFGGNGSLAGSACNTTVCVADGTYLPTDQLSMRPLAIQSINNGSTWSYVIDETNSPANQSVGDDVFTAAACATASCIAVGQYSGILGGDTVEYPLIYVSVGGSPTYTIAVDTATGNLGLSSLFQYTVTDASCSGNLCVVVGTSTQNNGSPLILKSTTGGTLNSWTVVTNPTNTPADLSSVSAIGGVNCQGNYCVIAGQYLNASNTSLPLVIQSTDGGLTWNYVVNSTTPAMPSDTAQIFFADTSVSQVTIHKALNDKVEKTFNREERIKKMLEIKQP